MKITNTRLGTGVVTLGELVNFTTTVKMGSDEKVNSGFLFELLFDNRATLDDFSIKIFKDHGDGSLDDYNWAADATLGSGKTKTFQLDEAIIEPQDSTVSTVGGYDNLFDSLIAFSGDGGQKRKYPLGLKVTGYYGGNKEYTQRAYNVAELLLWRESPKILGVSYLDKGSEIYVNGSKQTPFEYFGAYIQGESTPCVKFDYELDPLDNTLTADFALELIAPDGSTTIYSNSTGNFELPSPTKTGTYVWNCYLIDSSGAQANEMSGSYSVLPYSRPKIYLFDVNRYSIETDSVTGTSVYKESDDGVFAWVDFAASVTGIDGGGLSRNRYSVTVQYSQIDGSGAGVIVPYSQPSGDTTGNFSKSVTKDISMFPSTSYIFSAAYNYKFVVTVSDLFGAATDFSSIDKATADFNVESNGVAVGMMSTGKSNEKSFEVASTHTSKFYGGVAPIGAYEAQLGLTSNTVFSAYEGNPVEPVIKSFGPIVELHGEIQPNKTIAGGTSYYPICKIPDRYLPNYPITFIQQGTGRAIWTLRVFPKITDALDVNKQSLAGMAAFTRYRLGDSWGDITNKNSNGDPTWLPFHAMWIVGGSSISGGGGDDGGDPVVPDIPADIPEGYLLLTDNTGAEIIDNTGAQILVKEA